MRLFARRSADSPWTYILIIKYSITFNVTNIFRYTFNLNEVSERERIPLAPRQPCIEARVPLVHPVVTIEHPTSSDNYNKTNNINNNNNTDAQNDVLESNECLGKLESGELASRPSCSSRSTCNWDVCSYEATSKSCCSSLASSRSSINSSEVFVHSRFTDAVVQCEAGSIDRAMNR